MIELKDRWLSKSGVSLLTHEEAARHILQHGDLPPNMKVENSSEARQYQLVYGQDIVFNEFCDELDYPDINHTSQHYDRLVTILEESPRWDSKYFPRVRDELDFFDRTNNIKFLLALHEMVCKFKRNNVVWGVGRGSSVASMVLYLLEVHDINPLTYNIPFYELSKEK